VVFTESMVEADIIPTYRARDGDCTAVCSRRYRSAHHSKYIVKTCLCEVYFCK